MRRWFFLLAGAGLLGIGWGVSNHLGRTARSQETAPLVSDERGAEPPKTVAFPSSEPDAKRPATPSPLGVEPHTGHARAASESAAEPVHAPLDDLVQCVLHGRVLRAGSKEGWPIQVCLTDSLGVQRSTEARADGHYSFAGLAPGAWSLSWGGVEVRTGTLELVLSAEEPIVRRDLAVQPAVQLPIRVTTPSGETFYLARQARRSAGGSVPEEPLPVATLEPPGDTIEEAADAGQNQVGVGSFWDYGPLVESSSPGILGVLVLTVDLPVYVSLVVGSRVLATRLVEAGATEVHFVQSLESILELQGRISLRVVAEDSGEPLNGILRIEPHGMLPSLRDGRWSGSLPCGHASLCPEVSGYALLPIEIELAPGQELDLGEVRLPPELTVEGRLLDSEGQAVRGELTLGQRDARGVLRFEERYFTTDLNGRFRIGGLVPGRYVLRTAGDDEIVFPARDAPPTLWVSGNVPVSTLGGSVNGFDLHLVRAGILVLKGAESLAPRSIVWIVDEKGDALRGERLFPGFVPCFALPPGSYTLILGDEKGKVQARHPLTIGSGTTELDLRAGTGESGR